MGATLLDFAQPRNAGATGSDNEAGQRARELRLAAE